MIQVIRSIDIKSILECYVKLDAGIKWTDFGHKGRQTGLQYCNDEDPWTSAVGKGYGDVLQYTHLNPFFLGTIFEELIDEFKMFRTRLMWIGPYACYSMHNDLTPRIHIPIITNSECYFVFKQGLIFHLALGEVYKTDTLKTHTFMNCSDRHRLHLVGCIK